MTPTWCGHTGWVSKECRPLQGVSFVFVLFVLVLLPFRASAEELFVATASNALKAVREIARSFQGLEGVRVHVVSGSTGKLYAQIVNGAPYHIFLSADKERPRLLEQNGIGIRGTRFTYARGVLVVWTRRDTPLDSIEELADPRIKLIAIANPLTAPYGRAAMEALKKKGLFEKVKNKLLYAENVSQALGFTITGNADASIVALSAVSGTEGRLIKVDPSLYPPIEQDAIALRDTPEVHRFLQFLRSARARSIFKKYGYPVEP